MLNRKSGVQYLGDGITERSKQVIVQLIHAGEKIEEVQIFTLEGQDFSRHCLLLTMNYGKILAIKGGLTSGYLGEGSRGYSFVLTLLSQYTENIDEFIVHKSIFERFEDSCLTIEDLELIGQFKKVRPSKWREYIFNPNEQKTSVFNEFPLTIPMALVDSRLISIALVFTEHPDVAILDAYRKLESVVRQRTNLTHESSTKLFAKAFQGDDSILFWKGLDSGECKGRASLFTGTFMAYRNNRAHQEPKHILENDIREFLLVNQLFVLESESVLREVTTDE